LEALSPADTLVLSGSAPRSLPQDIYARIARCTAEKGARLVVDASGELLTSTLPYRPFLIKPNREELSALFGEPADTDEAVLALVGRLQAQGAQHVLISMAGDGALLCTADGAVYRAPAAKGTVVNSVGAGDSMVGGFLAGYERTGDFAEALALGTAAGGATAFSVGIAGFQKIMAIYESVKAGVRRIG
ncbi:MAG: 1-phosphofructokinase family hexose kinase, partial [Hominenteromicrobium sp.]